jgi:hypothetical protein
VLAGVLTAAGVVGTLGAYGPLGLLLVSAALWLLVSVMVWGAFSDDGVTHGRAVRYGGIAAHSFGTAIGVLILFPVAGRGVSPPPGWPPRGPRPGRRVPSGGRCPRVGSGS